jgi:hypothetical protein
VDSIGAEWRVGFGNAAPLEREATEPPYGRPPVALRISIPEHKTDPQRVLEPDLEKLPRGSQNQQLVPDLERASEAGVGTAVARHEHMFLLDRMDTFGASITGRCIQGLRPDDAPPLR